MGDLFDALTARGVSTHLLVAVLRYAALVNPDDSPLFVILGTPMRGVAGTDQRTFHLAAWRITSTIVAGLKLSLAKYSTDAAMQELGHEMEALVIECLAGASVQWCPVVEDRPEIITRRDHDSALAWFSGKTVALWGCGAIGSHVAEFLTRAGVKKLILRDNGRVKPGLLVRQLFNASDAHKLKIEALTERLRLIRADIEIVSHGSNLITGLLARDCWTDGADVVIESTGSNTLLTRFEATRHRCEARVPIVSMCLGHRADKAMVLVAGAAFSGGLLDIDRKLRQVVYRRPALSAFAHEFWPAHPRTETFQPEPGCSDPTFVGSMSDVASMTGMLLNRAARELSGSQSVASAHLIDQASGSPTGAERFAWPADRVVRDPESGFAVRVSQQHGVTSPGGSRQMTGYGIRWLKPEDSSLASGMIC